MNAKWDQNERRKPPVEGRFGRRPADVHCPQHELLWAHHETDSKNYREITYTKISEIKLSLSEEVERLEKVDANLKKVDEALECKIETIKNTLVGKYWFRIVIGGLCAAMLYIAAQNRISNVEQTVALKELAGGQKEIISTINSIENTQIKVIEKIKVFETEIDKLNKRQDVLRDQNLKIIEDKRK